MSKNATYTRKSRIRKMLKDRFLIEENEMIEEIIENLVSEYINLHHIQKAIDENGTTMIDRYGSLIPSKLLDARKNIQSTIKNQTELLEKLTEGIRENQTQLQTTKDDPVLKALGLV
ncbi:hypothetical protein IEO70_02205 [Bacillus sp. AGMB 02131]|uniref:Uncharacterized protein n=1 Tax=Peribacillus faecalis TaxID=2772559 RepID=A0A927H939_9BACI|nr:hypothetical protein [Peribacillus faecalis]MBD3107180.1 hypothetical protein [Peribacillus faecalis]